MPIRTLVISGSSMSVNISPNIGRINVNITIMTSTSRIISTMGYARAPLTWDLMRCCF